MGISGEIAMQLRVLSRPLVFISSLLAILFIGSLMAPLAGAKVTCATQREGNQNVTYSCPDNHTCFQDGGKWKCRPPRAAGMSCTTCYNNQKRDSDSCMTSGNDMTKLQCVNRVNAELNKCLSNCQ